MSDTEKSPDTLSDLSSSLSDYTGGTSTGSIEWSKRPSVVPELDFSTIQTEEEANIVEVTVKKKPGVAKNDESNIGSAPKDYIDPKIKDSISSVNTIFSDSNNIVTTSSDSIHNSMRMSHPHVPDSGNIYSRGVYDTDEVVDGDTKFSKYIQEELDGFSSTTPIRRFKSLLHEPPPQYISADSQHTDSDAELSDEITKIIQEEEYDSVQALEKESFKLDEDKEIPKESKTNKEILQPELYDVEEEEDEILSSSEKFKQYLQQEYNYYAFGRGEISEKLNPKIQFLLKYIPKGVYYTNPIRYLLLRLTTSNLFQGFIIFCILINCIFLMLYDPFNPGSVRNQILDVSEYIFATIFIIEMILKILAQGIIFHPNCYLRNAWNVLDCVIVLVSAGSIILEFVIDIEDIAALSVIRSIRILKPLRAIATIPAIRVIIQTLVDSIPDLNNTFLLFLFFLYLFSIAGLQLFQGATRQVCIDDLTGKVLSYDENCGLPSSLFGGRACPSGSSCKIHDPTQVYLPYDRAPFFGIINFDTIFTSMITVFQCVTMESWSNTMYNIVDARGEIFSIYFFALIFAGSFFVVNLLVGIISEAFEKNQKETTKSNNIKTNKIVVKIVDFFNMVYDKLTSFTPQFVLSYQKFVKNIVTSIPFRLGITLLILLNTVTLSMEYYGQPQLYTDILTIISDVFTGIFTFEVLLKLSAFGARDFFSDWFNIFDLVVVIIAYFTTFFIDVVNISALRILRLFRIIRLANSFKSLKKIINALTQSVYTALMVTLLLGLLIFIYALVGMQIFGGQFKQFESFLGEPVRTNFDDLFSSFITVFQIITGENWNSVMYLGTSVKWWYSFYFLTLFIFGNFIILNLFVAVLIEKVQNGEAEYQESTQIRIYDVIEYQKMRLTYVMNKRILFRIRRFQRRIVNSFSKKKVVKPQVDPSPQEYQLPEVHPPNSKSPLVNVHINQEHQLSHQGKVGTVVEDEDDDTKSYYSDLSSFLFHIHHDIPTGKLRHIPQGVLPLNKPNILLGTKARYSKTWMDHLKKWAWHNPFKEDYALFFLPRNMKIRQFLRTILSHRIFELVLTAVILGNTVLLAFEHPFLPPDSIRVMIIEGFSMAFTIIFIIEALLKILAYGFVLNESSYLRRSGWNIIDFFIVVVSSFSLITSESSMLASFNVFRSFRALNVIRSIRSVRVLRALRPLRIINKLEGLKTVLDTLISSIPSVINVLLIAILMYLIWGVMGVQLYGGKLFCCSIQPSTFQIKADCLAAGGDWEHLPSGQHFDTIFNAILTLFEVSTMEGWVNVMYSTMDAVSTTHVPIRDYNRWHAFYIISFIIIGSFVMTNLFVGVLIDRYNKIRLEKQRRPYLTEKQDRWYNLQLRLIHTKPEYVPPKPRPPRQKYLKGLYYLRLFLYRIVIHKYFEVFIVILTLINAIFLSLSFYPQPSDWELTLDIISICFTVVFTIEIIVKILVLGVTPYFSDRWNIFDFCIQVLSLTGVLIERLINIKIATSLLRTFRVIRLFKIIKRARGIRTLMITLWLSIPSIFNVFGLLVLLFFIYGTLGLNLFGKSIVEAEYVSRHANFSDLWTSVKTLVRMITGEDWQGIMHDYMDSSNCSPKLGNCVHPALVFFYFSSFILIGMFTLLNLFIAIILENFSIATSEEHAVVSKKDIENFAASWLFFDSDFSGEIPYIVLPAFIQRLGMPLGIRRDAPRAEVLIFLETLNLQERAGSVNFYQTLKALADKYKMQLPATVERELKDSWEKKYPTYVAGSNNIQDVFSPILRAELNLDKQDLKHRNMEIKQDMLRRHCAATLGQRLSILLPLIVKSDPFNTIRNANSNEVDEELEEGEFNLKALVEHDTPESDMIVDEKIKDQATSPIPSDEEDTKESNESHTENDQ